MGKWRGERELKIEPLENIRQDRKQRAVLFNLTMQKVFNARSLPSPTILFKKKFAESAFFHNFASFQVNKCPLYGQMVTRALNRPRGNNAAHSTL